jgi:hypothetical protein
MRGRLLSFSLASSLALTALLASALPVAAVTLGAVGVQFVFADGSVKGIVVLDRNTSGPRLFAVVRTAAGERYALVGRTITCAGTPSLANRAFRAVDVADAQGDVRIARSIDVARRPVRSLWVRPTDGSGPWACANGVPFEKLNVAAGDVNGDGAIGIISRPELGALAAVEKLPNGQARLSIVVDPHDAGDIYVVTVANRACGVTPTKYFQVEFSDVLISGFASNVVEMTQAQLDALRSVRVRNMTDGVMIGCAPLGIIGVLIA